MDGCRSGGFEDRRELPSLGPSTSSNLWELNFAIEELFRVFSSNIISIGDCGHSDDGNILSSDPMFGSKFHVQLTDGTVSTDVSIFFVHVMMI